MNKPLIFKAVIGVALALIVAAEAHAGRIGRALGNNASKLIAVDVKPGSGRAQAIVYANLVEANAMCWSLNDLQRLNNKVKVGDSIAYLGDKGVDEDGCTIVRRWWRVARSPKGDAITGIKTAIAVWMYGQAHPEHMEQFIGTGDKQLSKSDLESLAERVPAVIRAFGVWGFDLRDYSGTNERIRELEAEVERLRSLLDAASSASFDAAAAPNECEPEVIERDSGRCVGAMLGIRTHVTTLRTVVTHVSGAQGGVGHHPGLEPAVAGIDQLSRPFAESF